MATLDVYLSSNSYCGIFDSRGSGSFGTNPATPRAARPWSSSPFPSGTTYSLTLYFKYLLPTIPGTLNSATFFGNVTSASFDATQISSYVAPRQDSSFSINDTFGAGALTGSSTAYTSLGYSNTALSITGWGSNVWVIVRGNIIRSSYASKTTYNASTFTTSTSVGVGNFIRLDYTPPDTAPANNLYTFTA